MVNQSVPSEGQPSVSSFSETTVISQGNRSAVAMAMVSVTKTALECLLCGQTIIDRSKCVQCCTCGNSIHFGCAESGMLDEKVLRITRIRYNKAMVQYLCAKCSPTPLKGRLLIEKDGQVISQETTELKMQIRSLGEKLEKMSKELERVKQRNNQLNEQIFKAGEGPSTAANTEDNKVIALLQKQLEIANMRSEQLGKVVTLLEGEKLNPPTEDAKDLAIRERDEIIAKILNMTPSGAGGIPEGETSHSDEAKDLAIKEKDDIIVNLNTQIAALLNKKTSLPSAKRPRTDDVPSDNINLDNQAEIMDIDENEPTFSRAQTVAGQGLDLNAIETMINRILGPIRADMGNIHDRLDSIQYPENTPDKNGSTSRANDREFPILGQNRGRPNARINVL